VRRAQDVGSLGHEVHAAEDDVLRLRTLGRPLREFEAVAAHVGELNYVLALVMMPEDDEARAELFPRDADAFGDLIGLELEVGGRDVLLPVGEGSLFGQRHRRDAISLTGNAAGRLRLSDRDGEGAHSATSVT
jgi:hypothetical protein